MSQPQFPDMPLLLPRTQEDWTRFVAIMNTWRQLAQPLLQLLDTGPATSATAGSASSLPATPAVYLVTTIDGTIYKVPGYNV